MFRVGVVGTVCFPLWVFGVDHFLIDCLICMEGAGVIRGDGAMTGGGVSNRRWSHERDLQGQ